MFEYSFILIIFLTPSRMFAIRHCSYQHIKNKYFITQNDKKKVVLKLKSYISCEIGTRSTVHLIKFI